MGQVLNLTYASSLTNLCELNSSFDKGTLRIAYTGRNRNGSYISKEAFVNCIRTMYNCPVVCNYDRETDTLGGHDMEVVRGADGGLRIINATTPVGCIPESAKWWFEDVKEEDGTVHEYLVTEALLWKRQEAYRKIREDGITAQSMEITVRDGEHVDGVLHIRDFEFTAFCLIGVEPCYEGASLTMSLAEDFKQQLSEMMQELKESFSMVAPSEEVNNIHRQEISMEGGEKVLHEKTELAASYGIDVSTLDFNLDDFTIEELTEKFEAMKAEAEAVAEPETDQETFAEEEAEGETTRSDEEEYMDNSSAAEGSTVELLTDDVQTMYIEVTDDYEMLNVVVTWTGNNPYAICELFLPDGQNYCDPVEQTAYDASFVLTNGKAGTYKLNIKYASYCGTIGLPAANIVVADDSSDSSSQ